jgi:ubiquinone/menaquinone biosynthesis C-methylase UbiE
MYERIKSYYENYDEDGRLFRDNAHQVEYLTTIRCFDRLFAPGSKILDACAGTGRYSFYLADKGHIVTACDLVEHNINIIKTKTGAHTLNDIAVCDALDLSRFGDNAFDVVLCMGALYHFRRNDLREKAMSEAIRVCKPGGMAVFAYITKIGAILASMNEDVSNMEGLIKVIQDTDDRGPFYCVAPREIEAIAEKCGLKKLHHIGVDGIVECIGHKLNNATDENFQKYMEYHYMTCEDESIIGASIHGLYIGKKNDETA